VGARGDRAQPDLSQSVPDAPAARSSLRRTIHVVEPTLVDQTGHCHSFVGAVCASGPDQRFEIWAGRPQEPLFTELPQVTLHRHFVRQLRKPQALLLLRRLLRGEGHVFLPTASTTDLQLVCWAASGTVPRGKASFFFHWIRDTRSRRQRLSALAVRQPNLHVMGATEEIASILRECGFARVSRVPYPLAPSARPSQEPTGFRHLLFAGAARIDKGFPRIVDLAQRLGEQKEAIPLSIQTSTRHYGKVDPEIARELARLDRIAYPGLRACPQTLDSKAYFQLFAGAICLQPYDRAEFAGRVSAVTVDALACGAPIVTTSGTWMGYNVARFDAGVTLESLDARSLHEAVRRLIDQYPRYSAAARRAATAIHQEHDARHLLDAVLSEARTAS
jgi:glycosyltransferase involved in cell wall biosynthesis